jgi:hypothetical protein
MTLAAPLDWTAANQQSLTTELDWLRRLLDPDGGPSRPEDEAPVDRPDGAPAIDAVAELFGLSAFERSLLLLCAGVELDGRLAAACARAHGDRGRHHVTFGVALAALPDPHWSALTPPRPLRRWRLIEIDPGVRLVDSPLRIDERVLHFIAGINVLDPRLHALLAWREPPALMAAPHAALADRLAAALSEAITPPIVHVSGDDPDGQEDVAAAIAGRLGLPLYVLRGGDLPSSTVEVEALATLCEREMRLLGGALLVQCAGDPPPAPLAAFADRMAAPTFVAAREPLQPRTRPVLSHAVDRPQPHEQKRLWLEALERSGARFSLNGTLDAVAAQFRLSAARIAAVAESVARDGAEEEVPAALWEACRASRRERLDDLAERMTATASWDDLVLPESSLAALRQIAAHVRQRVRVHDDWGFAGRGRRGTGVTALFCGESGTGKTLAAEVLAAELGLDLYRIDLSSVVSKYIGETEKNLKRVFDSAEDGGALLLFDEADALFGKRSEVKDSHDRYANIEVSYLLQRMDSYRGLAVLTTNMKTALDRAFQRRLRFIVAFPFPDADLREAIWRRVFPAAAPLGVLDFRRLARLSVPGGNIRNIALNAAFLAADASAPVGMDHLLAAAQAEHAKLERPFSESEMRGWA